MLGNSNCNGRKIRLTLLIVLWLSFQANAQTSTDSPSQDITEIPVEQLFNLEVVTASKFAQQVIDAPAAVTVVTAEDIRAYGYRTLAEILNSVRGLHTTYDRIYQYLGGRGFGRPGDYTGRIMVLIDGYAADDNLYNQSYLGNDGILDTALIDRVEYVPGSGSSAYGNNAYFGIINIVTKDGHQLSGGQASVGIGSYQSKDYRITYGDSLKNGADFVLSASGFDSNGQTLTFPEISSSAIHGLDYENNQRLFGKLHYEEVSIEGGYSRRLKAAPTAPYASDPNSRNYYEDTNGFLNIGYDRDISPELKAAAKTYVGYYTFNQNAFYSGISDRENDLGQWWGSRFKIYRNLVSGTQIGIRDRV
ncbi:Vitamin B12 transporter, putative [Ricinus communis]|uniref:Vitamin B12 transporter, putative n=1 Tax=Ricinus communis TaxID=3988 RepID=B9TBU6_RICCO|nr:Vitamin B12 transporter, putative [Ricinus communis]|eukprot:XP_002535715.1 uncharacterized protein LOC8288646 [Ricinus communis]